MATFTEEAMERATLIRSKILQMPFIQELAAGTITQEKFQFYLIQDYLYLKQYARVLAMLGARADDSKITQLMVEAAANVARCEHALHERFFTRFGLSRDVVQIAEPSPTCTGYTNFLLASQSQPFEVAFAAILPCYTIYQEVGTHIQRLHAQSNAAAAAAAGASAAAAGLAAAAAASPAAAAGNPYAEWIDTYGGEEFRLATEATAAVADALAARAGAGARAAMHRAFAAAARFEYMFWESAHRMEQWPFALDGSPPSPPVN